MQNFFTLSLMLAISTFALNAKAAVEVKAPRVLIAVAHPDDEYFFAATIYRITHDLGGTVDQVVITDGRGGFRYSLLSQPIYHETLTDQAVAAEKLPEIRRGELAESGKILGIHSHYFLNKLDQKTQDLNETFALWGGKEQVKAELKEIITKGNYDFVFTLLPTETNHGHHKAAGILSLEIVNEMDPANRPTILASTAQTDDHAETAKTDDPEDGREYVCFQGNDLTEIRCDISLQFDRSMKFGFKDNLNYQIIVSWMIAAHKSQGAFQLNYNKHRFEGFKVFSVNTDAAIEKAKALFERLGAPTDSATFKP